MTLSQLKTFLAVAEDGSVRAAAERLHVSQPSVSGSIAALSDEVGVALTERDGRGMKLSPAGEVFLPHAREALGLLEQGTRMAHSASAKEQATVRIAAVYTAAEFVLPMRLRAFREAHPEIPIQLEIGNREHVLELLGSREADIGIGGRAPDDGMYEGLRIATNSHVIVAAPDHPFANQSQIALRDLAGEIWLVREEASGTRRLVDEYLAGAHITPPKTTIGWFRWWPLDTRSRQAHSYNWMWYRARRRGIGSHCCPSVDRAQQPACSRTFLRSSKKVHNARRDGVWLFDVEPMAHAINLLEL